MMKLEDFIAGLKKAEASLTLYIMGCFGAPMTDATKKRYSNNYAYNKNRAALINGASADTFGFDCVCLIKGILWGWDGDTSKVYGGASYGSNDVPDIGVDAMLKKCTEISDDFSQIREGAFLWMEGHCGIYIGDGHAIECSPKWANGVQVTNVANVGFTSGNSRTWKKWGLLPYVEYPEVPVDPGEEFYQNFKAAMLRYAQEAML